MIVLPDIPEEDLLLSRAHQGDTDAMRLIYENYFAAVYQFIRLRVDDTDVAEDLASDVFLKLISALRGHTAPRKSLRGWLFQVARHVLHDHYGRRARFNQTALDEWLPAPAEGDPEIQFLRTLDGERCRAAIRRLSFDQQEAIILRFGQGLSLQETADIMDKNVNAVKQLQFRAVNSLRRLLSETRTELEDG